jgi:hypothetical protein
MSDEILKLSEALVFAAEPIATSVARRRRRSPM